MATSPGRYATLEAALQRVAASSAGAISVRKINTKELSTELGLDLGSSPNPVYEFEVRDAGSSFRAVAYTLALDGGLRPATRAEALGRGLAQGGGSLFKLNPFLLVFDFAGEQLLSVPAITLFGAFADKATSEALDVASTSTFSLSPNFGNATISMYARVSGADVWKCSLKDLDSSTLLKELRRVQHVTTSQSERISQIVAAIKARLTQQPIAPAAIASEVPPVAVPAAVAVVSRQQEDEIRIDPRLWRMLLMAIRSSPAVILVGPPGTGKTALLRQAVEQLTAEGLTSRAPLWATPDESWSARDLVGGETVVSGEIEFRPGWLLRSISEGRWLILDEANRADMDRIFGPVLTWLSGGSVVVGTSSSGSDSKPIELSWTRGPTIPRTSDARTTQYIAGEDWRLLGTYNALDAQRVFRFGAALGRRFARIPIPALAPKEFSEMLASREGELAPTVRDRVARLYESHYEREATRLGPAIFLAICNYARLALAEAMGGGPSLSDSPATAEPSAPYIESSVEKRTLAEAYVVHAGTVVAHLDEDELSQLTDRIGSSDIFLSEDLPWITETIRALV